METLKYSFKDFLTYVMIYAAHASLEITKEQKEHIIQKVGKSEYKKIKKEFDQHSDYQSIQLILALEEKYVDEGDEKEVLDLVKEVFYSDHDFTDVEEATYIALKRLNEHRD